MNQSNELNTPPSPEIDLVEYLGIIIKKRRFIALLTLALLVMFCSGYLVLQSFKTKTPPVEGKRITFFSEKDPFASFFISNLRYTNYKFPPRKIYSELMRTFFKLEKLSIEEIDVQRGSLFGVKIGIVSSKVTLEEVRQSISKVRALFHKIDESTNLLRSKAYIEKVNKLESDICHFLSNQNRQYASALCPIIKFQGALSKNNLNFPNMESLDYRFLEKQFILTIERLLFLNSLPLTPSELNDSDALTVKRFQRQLDLELKTIYDYMTKVENGMNLINNIIPFSVVRLSKPVNRSWVIKHSQDLFKFGEFEELKEFRQPPTNSSVNITKLIKFIIIVFCFSLLVSIFLAFILVFYESHKVRLRKYLDDN